MDELFDFVSMKENFELIDRYFSKITERKSNLSISGISTRNYFHWKSQGLITESEENVEKRSWVKLNVLDFVWLRIIQNAREFGIGLSVLQNLKGFLEINPILEILKNQEEYLEVKTKILLEDEGIVQNELKFFEEIYNELHLESIEKEDKFLFSQLGLIVITIIHKNIDIHLRIVKMKDDFVFDLYESKSFNSFQDDRIDKLNFPFISIPLRPLVYDFLEEPLNEKHLEDWGFIRKEERKILEAIRNKDFKEITIKRKENKDELHIEATIENDIMNDKAKEIRRILGMKDYSEVTLKLRNEKHLFVRNKMKL
ncbi:MAG: hypothetical protein RL264_2407 [Bacteroidota bacterium]|jgi:hypothetical protein